MPPTLEESRELLLDAVRGADVTFYRSQGNRGDDLIEAGTRALLDGAGVPYRVVLDEDIRDFSGDLLVIGGGGGWSRYWHHSPVVLLGATGFERVVVFPSSFDLGDQLTSVMLTVTGARMFAREAVSAEAVPGSVLAHCPSFFFDFKPWIQSGHGTLHAYRSDHESLGEPVPDDNVDISLVPGRVQGWLGLIAGYAEVHTDRAHVMVAAALLGKRVRYRPNAYHKVASMAQTWLGDYDVEAE